MMRSIRVRAALVCWAFRAVVALGAALGPAVAVARVVGAHPSGDAALWAPGGLWLCEAARLLLSTDLTKSRGLPLASSAALFGLGLMLWLLPLGALIAACGAAAPARTSEALAQGARALGRLALLSGLALFAEALLVLAAALSGRFAVAPFTASGSPRGPMLAGALVGAVAAFTAAVVADLARAAIVWRDAGALGAIALGWRGLRQRCARLLFAAGWRALCAIAVTLGAGRLLLAVAGGHPAAAVGIALGTALVAVALRASWFGAVAELVKELGILPLVPEPERATVET